MPRPVFLSLASGEKIIFVKHLAVMLDAGIPLREALTVLNEQLTQPSFRYILTAAIVDMDNGLSLHTTLEKFPKVFDAFFSNAVSVGEASGTLPNALRYLATQLEKTEELRGKIRAALFYPAIVLVGAVGIGMYLSFYLLPKLLPIFASLRVTLPPTTRALLTSSRWLQQHWLAFFLGIVVVITTCALLLRIRKIRYVEQRALLALPILGTLIKNIETARFARIFGTLLNSGVKIVPALTMTSHSLENLVYQNAFQTIAAAVERGETVGSVLKLH